MEMKIIPANGGGLGMDGVFLSGYGDGDYTPRPRSGPLPSLGEGEKLRRKIFFYFFFSRFSLRYIEIGPSEFVGVRKKVLYSMRATRGNKKHGISPNFQLKIRKILCFDFSQIYGFLTVKIGRSRRQN